MKFPEITEENFDSLLDNLFQNKVLSSITALNSAYSKRKELINIGKKNAIKAIPAQSIDISHEVFSNFLYENSTTFFVNDDTWDLLFKNLLSDVKERINDPKNIQFPVQNLKLCLAIIFKNLNNSLNPKNIYIKWFQSLRLAEEDFINIITKVIQHTILGQARKEAYKFAVEELKVKFTAFSARLGKTTLQLFINKYKKLAKILYCYKTAGAINLNNLNDLKDLLLAILLHDFSQCKEIYENLFGIKYVDIALLHGLNNIVLDFSFDRYLESNAEFFDINQQLSQFYTKEEALAKKQDLLSETLEITIGIGSEILKGLITLDVCENTLIAENNKTTYYIKLKKELTLATIASEPMQRPALVENNIHKLRDSVLENDLFTFYVEKTNQYIHPNHDLHTTIPQGSFLSQESIHSKQSIDRKALFYYLYIYVTLRDNSFNLSREIYNTLLYMHLNYTYKIDFEQILLLNTEDNPIIQRLIDFCLELNTITDSNLKKDIKEITNKEKAKYYEKIYSKIINYKVFFIGLLSEAIIYSIFGYFLVYEFIDSRGRHYIHGYQLNIQQYPIAKAFVKQFNPMTKGLLQKSWGILKGACIASINTQEIKDAVGKLTFEDYLAFSERDSFDYLYKFFDNTKVTLAEFKNMLNSKYSINALWNFIVTNVQKKEEIFRAFSYVNLFLNPSSVYSNTYGLDASQSGIQMTAMLFKSKRLATYCNLIGETKFDLYGRCASEFKDFMLKIKEITSNFIAQYNVGLDSKDKNPIQLSEKEFNRIKDLPINSILNIFLYIDFERSYMIKDLLVLIENKIKNINVKDISIMQEYFWLLPNFEYKLIIQLIPETNKILKNLSIYLLLMRFSLKIYNTIEKFPMLNTILFSREAFKSAIMTFQYSSKPYGRKERFKNYILECLHDTYGLWYSDRKDIYILGEFMEGFFCNFKDRYLYECNNLLKVSSILAATKNPIKIKNNYLEIIFIPIATKKKAVKTLNFYNVREKQLIVRIPKKEEGRIILDKTVFSSKFGPNFIHSMDATLVHIFYEILSRINYKIKPYGLYVNHFVNHDNFFITLNGLLRYIILDSYKTLNNINYFETIKDSIDLKTYNEILNFIEKEGSNNYLPDTFNNEYFVKV